jgi:hypothetical protein
MGVSAVDRVARRDSRKLRALIQCPGYRALVEHAAQRFGYDVWTLTKDQNEKDNYVHTGGGQRQAIAYGAGTTGDRLSFGILDDPMGADEFIGSADQVAARCEEIQLLWREVFASRFQRGVVCIAQRLGEEDLPGYWLAHEHGVHHVCLPLRFENDHPNRHPDDDRQEGQLLSPATIAISVLGGEQDPELAANRMAERLGEQAAGQLQQRPVPRGSASKVVRAKAITPIWQAGQVFLPTRENAPWIDAYIREHLAFPRGRHDDDVDSSTQLLQNWAVAPIGIKDQPVDAKKTLADLQSAFAGGNPFAQGGQFG